MATSRHTGLSSYDNVPAAVSLAQSRLTQPVALGGVAFSEGAIRVGQRPAAGEPGKVFAVTVPSNHFIPATRFDWGVSIAK